MTIMIVTMSMLDEVIQELGLVGPSIQEITGLTIAEITAAVETCTVSTEGEFGGGGDGYRAVSWGFGTRGQGVEIVALVGRLYVAGDLDICHGLKSRLQFPITQDQAQRHIGTCYRY